MKFQVKYVPKFKKPVMGVNYPSFETAAMTGIPLLELDIPGFGTKSGISPSNIYKCKKNLTFDTACLFSYYFTSYGRRTHLRFSHFEILETPTNRWLSSIYKSNRPDNVHKFRTSAVQLVHNILNEFSNKKVKNIFEPDVTITDDINDVSPAFRMPLVNLADLEIQNPSLYYHLISPDGRLVIDHLSSIVDESPDMIHFSTNGSEYLLKISINGLDYY